VAFRRRRIFGRTESVDDTRALAAAVARLSRPGDLILLAGDLGAGKTAFVQGFGQALGVTEPITSPTFALAQRYDGTHGRVVHHLDVYRLEQLHEVLDLDIAELLDGGGTVLVEWGDAVTPALPSDYLEVSLAMGDYPDERLFTLHPVGPRWCAREDDIVEAATPWAKDPD
jgi:tRNA threonylcarbamoyladenosine biosynthesis protein TsaE